MKRMFKMMAVLLSAALVNTMVGCKNNANPTEMNDSTTDVEMVEGHLNLCTVGVVDFDTIVENAHDKFRGGEGITKVRQFSDDLNKVMRVRVTPGATVGMHTHDASSEVIMVLEGCGMVILDNDTMILNEGNIHYCPKGHSHSVINDSKEDLVLCCVVANQ